MENLTVTQLTEMSRLYFEKTGERIQDWGTASIEKMQAALNDEIEQAPVKRRIKKDATA
jgi:hypothetical protein